MSHPPKSWVRLAVASALALAAGYALPRPGRQTGDLLDAVAAVQRRSPRFLVSEPRPPATWARAGALYLCRTPKTAEDLDALSKYPGRADARWAGVVCFQGTDHPRQSDLYLPGDSEGGDRCLHYGAFAVFGDPELLQEVQAILAAEGFRPTPEP